MIRCASTSASLWLADFMLASAASGAKATSTHSVNCNNSTHIHSEVIQLYTGTLRGESSWGLQREVQGTQLYEAVRSPRAEPGVRCFFVHGARVIPFLYYSSISTVKDFVKVL